MIDYQLGKVYKIVGNGKVYVGSTTKPLLCQRFSQHRADFKSWKNGTNHYKTSYECMDDPECYIELLETCPCNSKDELHIYEGKWIRSLECVNKRMEDRKKTEYYKNNKEYCQQKARDNYYKKKLIGNNSQQIKEKSKEYYQQHKEHINQKKRERCARKKLLASNNSIPIDPANLSVEVQSQELNLIVEHE